MYKSRLIFLFCLLTAFGASGEVFWSFGKLGIPPWQQQLRLQILWEEPIRVNGVTMRLQGGISTMSLPELGVLLESLPPGAEVAINDDTVLAQWPETGDRRTSLLLSYLGDGVPMVSYSITRPAGPLPAPEWPSHLPMVPGAHLLRVMEYPERDSCYGELSIQGDPRTLLGDFGRQLCAGGWEPLAGEANTPGGTGEMYYRPASGELLLTGFNPTGTAFIYHRQFRR